MLEVVHAGAGLLGFWGLSAPEGPAWEFLVVFVVVAAGPKVVERAGVPGIVGLLLGGYVIGPTGSGSSRPATTRSPTSARWACST